MSPADAAPAAAHCSQPDAKGPRWANIPRSIAVAGVGVLLVVSLVHPSATRVHTWPWAAMAALLWLTPVVWLMFRACANRPLALPPLFVTVGAVVLAGTAVISAWASPFSAASLARTWPALGGLALVFLLHDALAESTAKHHRRVAQVADLPTFAGIAVVTASLVGWWGSGGALRNAFPFGHSTYTAGVMILLLPWFIGTGLRRRGAVRWVSGLAAIGALVVVATTGSRGAVLALGCLGLAAAVATLVFARWPLTRKVLLSGVVLLAVLTAVAANPRLRELVLERRWGDTARESNRQRTAMLAAGLHLGADRPLTGWGPGSVPLAYPRVRSELNGGVDNVLQLHNTPIQLWATLGAPGVVAAILLVVGTARAVAGLRRSMAPVALIPSFSAAASLTGHAIVALTDHQFDLPFVAALGATNLAVLTASTEVSPPRRVPRWAIAAVIIGVIVGPSVALARELLARRAYAEGVAAFESGLSGEYLAALERASRWSPHDAFFFHQAAAELLRRAEATSDRAQRDQLTQRAIERLEASLATRVHEELAHFNLGWLKLGMGEPAMAIEHFSAAARLVPDKGGVYFGLGLALLESNRRDDAVRAFALEWINDPRQLTSPAWELPALAALRPAIRAEVLLRYAELRPLMPAARVAESWTRWWWGDSVAADALHPAFTTEAETFATALPDIAQRATAPLAGPVGRLYEAWLRRDFRPLAAGDDAYASALSRRAARHPTDFRAFLTAGTEDDPSLMLSYRRQRTGYGVLALHPSGPLFTDTYLVQENRLLAEFASGLFPPKGWLPGRFLLAWLPDRGLPREPTPPR